jgi:photolyase PhrII
MNAHKPKADGDFVLCWLHHALRVEENPALLWAALCADAWDKPLLIYQGLFGQHPHNNQRHLTFILEGAQDLALQCKHANLRYVFALPEKSFVEASPLPLLAKRAAAVITELWPLMPLRGWTEKLAAQLTVSLQAVDSATVVPMRFTNKAFTRAFAFREHIAKEWPKRLALPWPALPRVLQYRGELPFVPLALEALDAEQLAARLRQLDADHSLPPVGDTIGGTQAGKARWQAFKRRKLALYHRDRNDAAKPEAVSRLSAYLHYGMLSPTTVAREAFALGGEGAEKYLDELIIWRDLAHQFCYHLRDLSFAKAVPNWAQETLQKHARDRQAPKNLEDLLRAKSGDALWDAAQQSLLWHGELHNNLRMTWGKAVVEWAPTPEIAYDWLQELNHRFALDGSDANSYGGILWCLGQFDRPFAPPKPIFGQVRPRPTADHARRLDLQTYSNWLSSPLLRPRPQGRLAVIGAGLTGLWAARILQDQGFSVEVFEKANRPGGRACSRRFADTVVDHGAAFLTCRSLSLLPWYRAWQQQELLKPFAGQVFQWDERGFSAYPQDRPRFLPKPSFQALAEHLAADLSIHYDTCISAIARRPADWQLTCENGARHEGFQGLLLAVLPSQAEALLAAHYPAWLPTLAGAQLTPTWVVGVHLAAPLALPFSAAFIRDNPVLSWAARANAQDGRSQQEIWVLHAGAEWSLAHLDAPPELVLEDLIAAWRDLLAAVGLTLPPVLQSFSKRWRYAQVSRPQQQLLCDAINQVAVGGDWLYSGRIESAFLAGGRLAACAWSWGRLWQPGEKLP